MRDLPIQACCWLKRKNNIFFGPHTSRNKYFILWSTLVYLTPQALMFYRFVYKVWEIYFFKPADLKEEKKLGPTHQEKIILSRGLPWSIKYFKLWCFIDFFIKFEIFAFSSMLTWKKKNIFLGRTHQEKIILSRGLPLSIKYLKF